MWSALYVRYVAAFITAFYHVFHSTHGIAIYTHGIVKSPSVFFGKAILNVDGKHG